MVDDATYMVHTSILEPWSICRDDASSTIINLGSSSSATDELGSEKPMQQDPVGTAPCVECAVGPRWSPTARGVLTGGGADMAVISGKLRLRG